MPGASLRHRDIDERSQRCTCASVAEMALDRLADSIDEGFGITSALVKNPSAEGFAVGVT